jgi:hypothetical protein
MKARGEEKRRDSGKIALIAAIPMKPPGAG